MKRFTRKLTISIRLFVGSSMFADKFSHGCCHYWWKDLLAIVYFSRMEFQAVREFLEIFLLIVFLAL